MIEDLSVVYLIPPMALIVMCTSLVVGVGQIVTEWAKETLCPATFSILLIPLLLTVIAGIMGYGNKQDLSDFQDTYVELKSAGVEIRPAFSRLVSMSREYAQAPSLADFRTLNDALDEYRKRHGREFVSLIEQGLIIDAGPSCFKGEASEYLKDYIAQYPLSTNIMKQKIKNHLTLAGTAGLVPGCALLK